MLAKQIKRTVISACLLLSVTTTFSAQESSTSLRTSALRLIDALDHHSLTYYDTRKKLAEWFALNRKYDQAFKQAEGLPDREALELVTFTAKLAIDAEDKEAADKSLSSAWSLLANRDDIDSNDLSYLAELAVQNGNPLLAGKFVSLLERGSAVKSDGLLMVARAYLRANQRKEVVALVDEALAQTASFDESENHTILGLTVEAAHLFASVGELERARELAVNANAALLSQRADERFGATRVAGLFAALGNLSQAIGMVESLDADTRMMSFASLSPFTKDTDLARALLDRSAELILEANEDPYTQAMKLSPLVSAYLKANRVDEAFGLLPKIRDPFHLCSSAVAVAKELKKTGSVEQAEAALDLAKKMVETIVSEKSEEIASHASFSNVGTKSRLLSTLVESYISIGSLSRAELAATAIDHPQFKATALARIAVAVAKKDRGKAQSLLKRGFSIASNAKYYNHDRTRESSLFQVARAMNEAGFTNEAKVATAHFLQELKKSFSLDQYLGDLFILGEIAESNGTPLSKRSQTLLKKIESQLKTNR